MNREINIIIRVMPNMDDVDISVHLDSTSTDIVEALLDSNLGIPRLDNQSNPISYQLVPKGKNESIDGPTTLEKAQVQNGDIILMLPRIIAG
jgi:hypothetical protein